MGVSPGRKGWKRMQAGRVGEGVGEVPDADNMAVRLLLQVSFNHPGSVLPVGHHTTAETNKQTNTSLHHPTSSSTDVFIRKLYSWIKSVEEDKLKKKDPEHI